MTIIEELFYYNYKSILTSVLGVAQMEMGCNGNGIGSRCNCVPKRSNKNKNNTKSIYRKDRGRASCSNSNVWAFITHSSSSSSSILDRDPSLEGIFGQGVFLEVGDVCDVAGESLWVSPNGCAGTLAAVEEGGMEEVPMLQEGMVLQQDKQEAGTNF